MTDDIRARLHALERALAEGNEHRPTPLSAWAEAEVTVVLRLLLLEEEGKRAVDVEHAAQRSKKKREQSYCARRDREYAAANGVKAYSSQEEELADPWSPLSRERAKAAGEAEERASWQLHLRNEEVNPTEKGRISFSMRTQFPW